MSGSTQRAVERAVDAMTQRMGHYRPPKYIPGLHRRIVLSTLSELTARGVDLHTVDWPAELDAAGWGTAGERLAQTLTESGMGQRYPDVWTRQEVDAWFDADEPLIPRRAVSTWTPHTVDHAAYPNFPTRPTSV